MYNEPLNDFYFRQGDREICIYLQDDEVEARLYSKDSECDPPVVVECTTFCLPLSFNGVCTHEVDDREVACLPISDDWMSIALSAHASLEKCLTIGTLKDEFHQLLH